MKRIRWENLNLLIRESGGRPEASELTAPVNITANYLGQLVNQSRGIGDKTARKLESAFSKPDGWLDHDHNLDQINNADLQIIIDLYLSDQLTDGNLKTLRETATMFTNNQNSKLLNPELRGMNNRAAHKAPGSRKSG